MTFLFDSFYLIPLPCSCWHLKLHPITFLRLLETVLCELTQSTPEMTSTKHNCTRRWRKYWSFFLLLKLIEKKNHFYFKCTYMFVYVSMYNYLTWINNDDRCPLKAVLMRCKMDSPVTHPCLSTIFYYKRTLHLSLRSNSHTNLLCSYFIITNSQKSKLEIKTWEHVVYV